MHRFLLLSLLVVVAKSASSQIIFEETLLPLPYKNVSGSFYVSSGMPFIYGVSSEQGYFPPIGGDFYYVAQPFFILDPTSPNRTIVLLPDQEGSNDWGTGAASSKIQASTVITLADSVFVLWSNSLEYFNDVPPNIVYEQPFLTLGKRDADSLVIIDLITNGWHPSIASDEQQTLHFVWEQVTPLDSVWGTYIGEYVAFSKYTSTVMYQSRDLQGNYSEPVEIGKGFRPQVKVRNDNIYVFFLASDSTEQGDGYISVAKQSNGSFGLPMPLKWVLISPWNFEYSIDWLNLRWHVDQEEGIHVSWQEYVEDTRKMFILHYSPAESLQIDTVVEWRFQRRFMDDGSVKLFGNTTAYSEDSTDFQYYLSTPGEQLHKVKSLSFPQELSLNHIIIDAQGYEHALFAEGTDSYILKYATTDSSLLAPLSSQYIFSPSSYVDDDGRVWMIGLRDSTTVFVNFLLNDIIASASSGNDEIPSRFNLYQNYPNPFNPTTTIRYSIPSRSFVTLKIFNLLGQEVATLVNAEVDPGEHQVDWNASGYTSGVYFYKLSSKQYNETKKLVLVK